jgi:hypothetical protein
VPLRFCLSARLAFKPRHPERSEGPLFAVAVAFAVVVALQLPFVSRALRSYPPLMYIGLSTPHLGDPYET